MNKQLSSIAIITSFLSLLSLGCDRDDKDDSEDDVTVISVTGDISKGMNQFRQVLGSPLNTTPGATGGRREITWDAVPDSLTNTTLPLRFFNPVGTDPALAPFQKGLAYEPGKGSFMVSNTNFSNVNPQASPEFSAFSGSRIFANTTNALWQIDPEVPGLQQAATVRGFGIVFGDVDKDSSTFIEFFNGTRSLGKFFVPRHDNTSNFSFLGVRFKNEKVTAIQVGHQGFLQAGEKDISQGGTNDLVVLDDFMYDEPVRR